MEYMIYCTLLENGELFQLSCEHVAASSEGVQVSQQDMEPDTDRWIDAPLTVIWM